MKKSCFAYFVLFFLLLPFNAYSYHLRAGVYGISQTPIGEAGDYFANAFGGGVCGEFGLSNTFGGLIRIQGAGVIPKYEVIKSAWQITQYSGIWYSFPFGNSGLAFQPSMELGLMFQGAKIKEDYGSLSKNAFTDFTFQFCPSLRYKNENFLNNKLEIEVSPIITFIVQKTGGLAFLGMRLGLLYVF